MKTKIIDCDRKFLTSVGELQEAVNQVECYFNIAPSTVIVIREIINEVLKTWLDRDTHEEAWKAMEMTAFLWKTDYFFTIQETE